MGLEDRDDASGVGRLDQLLSGSEHRGDLGRVVRVIVVDPHATGLTVVLKTAAHTVEVGDSGDDLLQVRAKQCPAGDRGDPIERHVGTRDGHADVLAAFLLAGQVEAHLRGSATRIGDHLLDDRGGRDIRVLISGRAGAVADHGGFRARRADPGCQRGSAWVVEAAHQVATRGDLRGELVEDRHIGLFGAVVVEVIRLDIRDHRDFRAIGEEGAIGLIGLGDEDLPGAVVGVRARTIQLPADSERWIEAGGLHAHHCHRGRGGLPVGARQQERAAISHEGSEHVGAADDGDPGLAGGGELGIILRNRGEGGHDNRRQLRSTGDVRGVVSDGDLRPGCTQRQNAAGILHVGAGHAVAPG